MKNRKIIMAMIILTINCLAHKSSLLDQNYRDFKGNFQKRTLYIRNIEITNEQGNLKKIQEDTLKSNIRILLENSKLYDSVLYYNDHHLINNSVTLDFKFKEYENTLSVDPYYFPLSIATLSLYIWFGGTIGNFESKIELELHSFDNLNKAEITKIYKDENVISDNIYDIWKSRRSIPQIKSKFIIYSIFEVLNKWNILV